MFERWRAATMGAMKENTILVVTCLLSILLATLHVTDDIVRGISKAESSKIALVGLVVFLYGTLLLAGRRSEYFIMLLAGLFAAAMPVLHMRGVHYGEIARSAGVLESDVYSASPSISCASFGRPRAWLQKSAAAA